MVVHLTEFPLPVFCYMAVHQLKFQYTEMVIYGRRCRYANVESPGRLSLVMYRCWSDFFSSFSYTDLTVICSVILSAFSE